MYSVNNGFRAPGLFFVSFCPFFNFLEKEEPSESESEFESESESEFESESASDGSESATMSSFWVGVETGVGIGSSNDIPLSCVNGKL